MVIKLLKTHQQNMSNICGDFPLAMDSTERASMTPVLSGGNVVFTAKIVLSPDPARVKCIDSAYQNNCVGS
jgi:hypothetical protein